MVVGREGRLGFVRLFEQNVRRKVTYYVVGIIVIVGLIFDYKTAIVHYQFDIYLLISGHFDFVGSWPGFTIKHWPNFRGILTLHPLENDNRVKDILLH